MHELGIVFYIIDGVEEAATKNSVSKVESVTLELGEVSGVVPDLLLDAWNWAAARRELTKGATLKWETIPAKTLCDDCGEVYDAVEHGRSCPACASENTHLLQGNEVIIKEISVT